jgi:hypothetical protein
MAKIVYACVRNPQYAGGTESIIKTATQRLIPDNISGAPCAFYADGGILYGISCISGGIARQGSSVCMGLAYDSTAGWSQPLSGHPDGTHAIFRSNEAHTEVLTDVVGSRAVWYYFDDNIFVAGTSQRAVTAVAGKFTFNKAVIPWVLSTGGLGPGNSWNKELQIIPPYASLQLDRKNWQLTLSKNELRYEAKPGSKAQHYEKVKEAIYQSFRDFEIDLSKWTLPMSGGYDSRGIGCLLKETRKDFKNLKSVTWGLKSSLQDKETDAWVGTEVAKALGLEHRYFETDNLREQMDKVFERYFWCGEGRVDHVTGYMDGFATWKAIYDSGTYGVIRGDENFGWHYPTTETNARLINYFGLCSDYKNLEELTQYSFEKQVIPAELQRRPDESLQAWADRLYEQYTLPTVMSGLNDLKLSYTEIFSPLLARKILLQMHQLPDHLRQDKVIFKKLVESLLPLKFAKKQATMKEEGVFASPEVVNVITVALQSTQLKNIFPEQLLQDVCAKLRQGAGDESKKGTHRTSNPIKNFIKEILPAPIKAKLMEKMPKPSVDIGILAFRLFTISRMQQLLQDDINAIQQQTKCPVPA